MPWDRHGRWIVIKRQAKVGGSDSDDIAKSADSSAAQVAVLPEQNAPIEKAPATAFGPRLSSAVCMLSGAYHLSRRQVAVVLKDLYQIDISVDSVSNIEERMSNALQTASNEAMTHIEKAKVKHIDETSWLRDSLRSSAWVFADPSASVFRIVDDGTRATLCARLQQIKATQISDRASVFLYWPMALRQICWSHLLRTFKDYSERDGPPKALAKS